MLRACLPWFALGAAIAGQIPPFPELEEEGWSVYLDGEGRATMSPGMPPKAFMTPVAWGRFSDRIDQTGWAVLDVHTSEEYSGADQSYAAGFLEGALTSKRMAQNQRNMWGVDFKYRRVGSIPFSAKNFSESNLRWLRQRSSEDGHKDPYWRMVGFVLDQLRGMTDGYNAARRHAMEPTVSKAEVLMQSVVDTDMDDLLKTVTRHTAQEVSRTSKKESTWRRHSGHCSALVQVAPNASDLFVGHATWDAYRAMLRIVKYFDMPLPGAKSRRVTFTSMPGSLYSGDDFYVTDTGLTVMETSVQNYNEALWQKVQPESMLTWMRTMVATRMAATGDEWTDLQLRHQSGTCNNQWMVIDYSRFQAGMPLVDGTLWVAETMPGHTHREDMTDVLRRQGSWPSYNIPYFPNIWLVGGYGEMQAKEGDEGYSFTRDTRARMFARARDEEWVTDEASMMRMMRYNSFEKDPLAHGNGCSGVASRCDLNPQSDPKYDCFGAIDAKVTSSRRHLGDLSFLAVSGPSNDEERPFVWHEQNQSVDGCKKAQHQGHPDTFDFSWYTFPSRVTSRAAHDTEMTAQPPRGELLQSAGQDERDLRFPAVIWLSVAIPGLFVAWVFLGRWSRSSASARDDYIRIEA